jgi:hypothetical protein
MRLDDTAGLRRVMLRIMLGALALSAALAVLGVLGGANNWDQSYRMIGTGVDATIASALLLASCKFLDSEKYRRTGLFVMAMILMEFILVLLALWGRLWSNGGYSGDEALAETAAIFPVFAMPAALFFHVRQLPGGRLAGLLGMASCALALALFLLGTWGDRARLSGPAQWMYWESGWACWFFSFAAAACAA